MLSRNADLCQQINMRQSWFDMPDMKLHGSTLFMFKINNANLIPYYSNLLLLCYGLKLYHKDIMRTTGRNTF